MQDDILNTLKGVLGDNAEEKIQSVLSMLNNSSAPSENTAPDISDTSQENIQAPSLANLEAIKSIGNLQGIVSQMGRANDARSTLLMSLKPYMRAERQRSIDSAIKLLNISKFSGLFKL